MANKYNTCPFCSSLLVAEKVCKKAGCHFYTNYNGTPIYHLIFEHKDVYLAFDETKKTLEMSKYIDDMLNAVVKSHCSSIEDFVIFCLGLTEEKYKLLMTFAN